MAHPCHLPLHLLLLVVFATAAANNPTHAADEQTLNAESWYSVEFDGQKAGYEWVRTTHLIAASDKSARSTAGRRVRRERQTQLQLQRAGTSVALSAILITEELPSGLLQSWELTRTAADGTRLHRRGTWDPARSAMRIEDAANSSSPANYLPSATQPYSPIFTEWLGQTATKPNSTQILPVLFPESAVVADVEIERLGSAPIQRPDGSHVAARQFSWKPVSAPQLATRVFFGPGHGPCLLVEQSLLGGTLRLVSSTPESALGLLSPQALDLQLQTLLPVTGNMPRSIPGNGLRLQLTWDSPAPRSLVDADFQTVESQTADGLIVVCRPPQWPERESADRRNRQTAPAEYLRASRWIDSTAPSVQRQLAAAGTHSGTTAEICQQLSTFVNQRMQFSPFTTQLQPASQVAAKLQGDCTEHTVLLCALLRCRGIPSRAAAGFAWVPQLNAFAPHLWTEALVDGIWMPLDSTIPPKTALPVLLKAADSPLGDELSSSASLFAPLLPLCGQVHISVLSEQ